MTKTKIEYLDYTWNPTHGCSPVGEGCRSCWAAAMSKRLAAIGVKGYDIKKPFKPTCHPDRLDEPLKIKKPSVIGVSFMGDLFHKDVPDSFIDDVGRTAKNCPQHIFIILTKRPQRMRDYFKKVAHKTAVNWPYEDLNMPNIWLGVSVEDQPTADERIGELLKVKAEVIVVSYEPALGNLLLPSEFLERGKQAWFIAGAETGPRRQECKLEWIRDVKNQCVEAGVPFFLKALYEDGKKVSMPVLDGRQYMEMPERR